MDSLKPTAFIRELALVGGPIALQNLFLNGLNLVDNLMIGHLGEEALAAVTLGNQVYFIYLLLGFGIASGTTVFTAQFWGRGDRSQIRKAFFLGSLSLGLGSLVFGVASVAFPLPLLGLYSTDTPVVALGAEYLRIVGWSYPLIGMSNLLAAVLRSTRDVHTPLQASTVALVANTLGNLVLIYGWGPIPAMGVAGAAIATLGSRVLELALLVILGLRKRDGITRDLLARFLPPSPAADPAPASPGPRLGAGEYYRRTIPVIGNEILWSTGYTMYALVYGRIGTDALAAYSILETLVKLSLILFIGSANAGAIIIGNHLGAGRKRHGQLWAERLLSWVPLASLALSVVLVIAAPLFPLAFNVSADTREGAIHLIRVYALVMPFKILNIHAIVAVLRAGGDTVFSLWADAGTLWVVGIPLAALFGWWLGWPWHWVYLAPLVEEGVKAVLMARRTWTGRWLRTP